MSEEIDRLKKEYDLAYYNSERKLALQRKQSDLEVQLSRVVRDLQMMDQDNYSLKQHEESDNNFRESMLQYEKDLKALDSKYAEALMPNKNRLITFAEAEKMVEQAKQEIMNMLRKQYGGL